MTVYVAEIGGRAVVAFNADNDLEAQIEIEDEVFKNDLAVLNRAGARSGMGKPKFTFGKPTRPKGESSTVREPKQFSKVRSENGNPGWYTWCPLVTPLMTPRNKYR